MSNTENFYAKEMNLMKLFAKKVIFEIPEYQRKYSWEKEQIEELISDLYDAYSNSKSGISNNYFLGSIVGIKDDTNHTYTIVDGQQRLTTLMILSLVLYRNFSDINKNSKDPFLIRKKNLKEYIWLDDMNEIDKLTINNQEYLERYKQVLKIESFEKEEENNSKKDSLKNYHNAAVIIYNKLNEIKKANEDEFAEFINYIYVNVYIVQIICTDESFAIKLFQVLNDRGMDLKTSDLLKVELKHKMLEEQNEKKKQYRKQNVEDAFIETTFQKQEEEFNSKWKRIEEKLDTVEDLSFDKLLVVYEYYKLKYNPKKSVWEMLKEIIKDEKNAINIIDELLHILNILIEEVYNNIQNKVICTLRYIKWEMYVLSILVTIKYEKKYKYFKDCYESEQNEKSEERLLKAIRRYFYLNWIAGKTLNTIKETSFNLIKEISNGEDVSKIEEMLENKLKETNITPQLISNNLRGAIRYEKYVKQLLLMVEYDITEEKEKTFIKVDKNLHLEHILPEAYKKTEDWKNKWKDEDAEEVLNTIGNLTLLTMLKNMSAKNSRFSEKILTYRGEKEYKNIQGLTKFDITKKIVDDYDKGTYNKEWNKEAVNDRKIYLLGKIGEILSIDILDENEKEKYKNLAKN